MSMINTGAGSATLESAPYSGQNRSRISWGAVLAGAVVAVATTLLLSLLGAAMGAGSIHALETTSTDLANYGIGAAIWEIINLALSMALGGYVAARLSGTHSHLDGELHGMTMWGVAVLLGSVLFAHAVSGVVGIVGQGAGSVVSRAVGGAGAISGTLAQEVNPQTTIERLQQSLGNNGDPTTMSHEQIGAEIRALVGSGLLNGSLSESDRDRLVGLVAAQSGVTKEEAARRVSRMENDAKARLAPIPFMNGIGASLAFASFSIRLTRRAASSLVTPDCAATKPTNRSRSDSDKLPLSRPLPTSARISAPICSWLIVVGSPLLPSDCCRRSIVVCGLTSCASVPEIAPAPPTARLTTDPAPCPTMPTTPLTAWANSTLPSSTATPHMVMPCSSPSRCECVPDRRAAT